MKPKSPTKSPVKRPRKPTEVEERTIVSFDYAIKYLLRDKADFAILNGFLSELLGRKVVVQAILESESNKVDKDEKTNRTDLKAQIDDCEIAVFEIQFYDEEDFFSRVLYGVAKAIIEQVPVGAKLYDVKKVYSVNIAYYDLGATREYLFNGRFDGFRGVNFAEETIPFAQARNVGAGKGPKAYIHPEYYLILPNTFDEKLRNRFDEWVYVLKNSAVRADFVADGMEEVKLKLDLLNMSRDERKAYEKYWEHRSSYYSAIYTARQDGVAEGRAEGLAEGRTEALLQAAKAMKNEGMDAVTIAKVTGLTGSQIRQL
ncbi:MAG: Rpn family recombination-promoting nuclease/putative transposase [Chitinispirillales bacterium]|jgi:predicted transposase/invertase (TIGR01784 family)|nr:Rpn family recombination-promoting nuclease/putative transposase [Chitinispirillales bacterium]